MLDQRSPFRARCLGDVHCHKDTDDVKSTCSSTQGFDGTKPSANLHSRIWLDPTCGVRCLACVGVVIFHLAWYTGAASADKHAVDRALAQHPWLTFIFNPDPSMQAFMCMTGFLASLSLVPALEVTHSYTQTVLGYYWKRAMRVIPAYYTVLVVIRALNHSIDESSGLPADMWNTFFGPLGAFDQEVCKNAMRYNIFFVQNQLPTYGCFTIAWSLAVQMQFWCMFPLALLALRPQKRGFRERAAHAFLATIGGVLVYRAWQVHALRPWELMPLQAFDPPSMDYFGRLLLVGRHGHFGSIVRLGPLCWGGLAALIVLDSSLMQHMSRNNGKVHALWMFLMISNLAGCFVNKYGIRDPEHVLAKPATMAFAYICIAGVTSPLLSAVTLVLTTTQRPGDCNFLAKALSHRAFRWLADITYDIFLLHALAILVVFHMLPPAVWFNPAEPRWEHFAAVSGLVLAACVAAAWVHNRVWGRVLGSFATRYSTVRAPGIKGIK